MNLKHRRHLAITQQHVRSLSFFSSLFSPAESFKLDLSNHSLRSLSFFSLLFFLVSCPFVFPLLFCLSFIHTTEADSKGPADPEHFVVVSCISTRVSAQVANLTGSSLIRPKVLGVCCFNRVGSPPPSSLPHLSTVCRSTPIASKLACGNLENPRTTFGRWSARQRSQRKSSCDNSFDPVR